MLYQYLLPLCITYELRASKEKALELAESTKLGGRQHVRFSMEALEFQGGDWTPQTVFIYDEHMLEHDLVVWILNGSGYFDVRDTQDEWVRIKVERHDWLVLPAGIYHRFTVDESNVSGFICCFPVVFLLFFLWRNGAQSRRR